MDDKVYLSDVKQNINFWVYFLGNVYPNAYDGNKNVSLNEYMIENFDISIDWLNQFTKYYEGVLEESDGYIDNPRTLTVFLKEDNLLEIEFHPGDIIFYINKVKVGSTGSHWETKKIKWEEVGRLIDKEETLSLQLILPMVTLKKEEINDVKFLVTKGLKSLPVKFDNYNVIIDLIIKALLTE